jgi:hypothetical protein
MTTKELTYYCDCGNRADNSHQEGFPDTCAECAHAEECETVIKKITLTNGYLSGQLMATCKKCDYKSAYWECNCDLRHNCKEWR